MIGLRLREFVLSNYYPLYHFQRYVDRYGVHYDRNRFRRVYEDINRYQLTQFRRVHMVGDDEPLSPAANFPLEIQNQSAHIRFRQYFFLFFALRCAAVLFVSPVIETEYRRVLIGTEYWGNEIRIYETTFFLWSLIGFLYFRFSLSKSLLDYKFLAIWRISPGEPEYLSATALRMSPHNLARLHRFRRVAKFFMHLGTGSICTFGPVSISLLFYRSSLYSRYLWLSILWNCIIYFWIYQISTLINTNLVQFLVVAKYIYIKQRSIVYSLSQCLHQIVLKRSKQPQIRNKIWLAKLIDCTVRYSHVQNELGDYARFWRRYLTIIFFIYVALIGLMLYILFYSKSIRILVYTFFIVFIINATILAAIIYHCGSIVQQNVIVSKLFDSGLAHFAELKKEQFSLRHHLKINNIGISLKGIKYGFSLINNYVLSYQTFYLLTVNIALYFMLLPQSN